MFEIFAQIIRESWLVLGQMAPFLLLGFLVAGVLSVCASPALVERHLGHPGLGSVLKASLLGVPLPLCSCGVIPVSASIYRHGASRAATTAFLLSTPQTGVDSIAVTYGLLGPVFAIYRPIAALITGLVGGGLVQLLENARRRETTSPAAHAPCQEACCAPSAPRNPLLRALSYGLVTLPRDIGGALLLGILIAGAIAALVPKDQLAAYIGGGGVSILLMMAVGVPIYVCATASVPIAVGFIHMGASPGAALAFLIAGPATNAAALTTIWKLLGRRTAVLYLLTVAGGAIAGGLLLNWLFSLRGDWRTQLDAHQHLATPGGWLRHAWALALLAVIILSSKSLARLSSKGRRPVPKEEDYPDASSGRQRLVVAVTGMTCSHCVESVRRALAEGHGVSSVEVDLARGHAVVTGDRLDGKQLAAAVAELGYGASLPDQAVS